LKEIKKDNLAYEPQFQMNEKSRLIESETPDYSENSEPIITESKVVQDLRKQIEELEKQKNLEQSAPQGDTV
jgi:hypothetical protein